MNKFLNKKNYSYLFALIFVIILLFSPVFIYGKLPIPSDTIVGVYHPFRDFYQSQYTRGFPFKNFLITDPVRQIIPWKYLSIDVLKSGQLPLWNPYELSGTPLMGNFQSSPFYPLNIIYFILPFYLGWTILVILQPFLAGAFLYLYLRNLKLKESASLFGGIIFGLCGFSISWLEWNTILQTALWLPLILLAKDKLLEKWTIKWIFILIFAEISSIFAGHLQTLFYAMCISNIYLFSRIIQKSYQKRLDNLLLKVGRLYIPFLLSGIVVLIVTAIQWFPTLQFINLSARSIDQGDFMKEGWFIPWQNLIQFIAPDFFGNPSTLNYWGIWNYGEFIGYIGIIPFVTVLFALLFRRDKKTWFFGTVLILALLMALPTPLSQLPYTLHLPFISTAQPTRLLFVVDFALAVLGALGFDYITQKKKQYIATFGIIGLLLGVLWIYLQVLSKNIFPLSVENIAIAKNNLILPTVLLIAGLIISLGLLLKRNNKKLLPVIIISLLLVTVFDLVRFGQKYEAFVLKKYLFPVTKSLSFLQSQKGIFRIASIDSRILPPNFPTYYKLQSIEGYDPLYLLSYGEFIAAMERSEPNITPPFGFNRIITPHNINSQFMDLLNVKYILSLADLDNPKLRKVFQEGETRIYENLSVMPRSFFVSNVYPTSTSKEQIKELFEQDVHKSAIVEMPINNQQNLSDMSIGTVEIQHYSPNSITIKTQNEDNGFLVLTDVYYPTWTVFIDGEKDTIYKTNYTFRGVFVPKGEHTIRFSINVL